MANITAKAARKLIAEGKAAVTSFVWMDGRDHKSDQPTSVAIDRYDIQRTDHFPVDAIALSAWIRGGGAE